MIKKLFSPEHLLTKVLSLTGLVLLAIVTFLYPRITALVSKATSETLSQIIVLTGTLFILIILTLLIIISSLNSENRKLKSEPEFIPRFNLNWKKTKNKIDPHPYCISCPTPHPLLITEYKIGSSRDAEHLKCIHKLMPKTTQWDGWNHWAQKNQQGISYKQAYKEVCEEFNIKPSKNI